VGEKNFTFTRCKFLLVTVKEWLKSVPNYRSYPKIKLGMFFWNPVHREVDQNDDRQTRGCVTGP